MRPRPLCMNAWIHAAATLVRAQGAERKVVEACVRMALVCHGLCVTTILVREHYRLNERTSSSFKRDRTLYTAHSSQASAVSVESTRTAYRGEAVVVAYGLLHE